jgi:hypothetical protein
MRKFLISAAAAACLWGGSAAAGTYLFVADSSANLAAVDVLTGQATLLGNTGIVMYDIAFAPDTTLYGVSSGSDLYKISFFIDSNLVNHAVASLIGPTGIPFLNALTFAPTGTLYGATVFGDLVTLNLATGAGTVVGPIGFGSSGDITTLNNDFYMTALGTPLDQLVKISQPWLTSNTAGTLVGSLGLPGQGVYALSGGYYWGALYAASWDIMNGQTLYSVDDMTGAATALFTYSYPGATYATGSSFSTEAGPFNVVLPLPPLDLDGRVPEPSSWLLLIAGFGLAGSALRRRGRIVA